MSATSLAASGPARLKMPRPAELNVFIGLVAIALLFEVLGHVFMNQSFLFNMQRLQIIILQVSIVGIIAVGVTQVIITGGIDLSSGSVVGATAMITMSFAQAGTVNGADNIRAVFWEQGLVDLPVIVPVVAALLCGLIAGGINGLVIAYTKIPPFIATLGMMVAARGVSKWLTKGQPVSFPTEAYAAISNGEIIAKGWNPVIFFLIIAVLFHLILKYTLYGKHTYAIGSNAEAARISGIKVERHLVMVYAIAGILAGIAALILTSKNLTAQAGMGVMYELDAIAMAVIGGVSLSGGRGSIIGTVLGALIFGVIISGFTFMRIDAYYQEMIKGVIIVAAVVADVARQRRRARSV
jgi:inositol transport system permease protein